MFYGPGKRYAGADVVKESAAPYECVRENTFSFQNENAVHVTHVVTRSNSAVGLLQGGVDRDMIALWLGHVRRETTQMYLDADLALKQRALARTAHVRFAQGRFGRAIPSWPS